MSQKHLIDNKGGGNYQPDCKIVFLGNDNDTSDEEIINFALFVDCEPMNFEEASGEMKNG
jgi:hypothetical protein